MGIYKVILNKLIKESLLQKRSTFMFVILIACLAAIVVPATAEKLSLKIEIYGVAIFSIILLRQWASESFAAEKENHTLEALISTCVNVKALFYAAVLFNYLLATLIEYILIAIFILANLFLKPQIDLSIKEWFILLLIHFLLKTLLSQRITWLSLISKDVRTANSRSSKYLFFSVFFASIVTSFIGTQEYYLDMVYSTFIGLLLLLNGYSYLKMNHQLALMYWKSYWQS